ncbi:hypothetical protein ATL39_2990 [Sinobaca qinghaiensis]|uniref:Uncharacterized protein n=1 Tax=Sinobaca qinghaiensis TaxID=342944 RepID=A0A419UWR3_9BACL|nr:hypothetical protein ATL39_2990 [Sinobaca qinghaiensis]
MNSTVIFYIAFYGLIIALYVDSFLGYVYPRYIAFTIIGILLVQAIVIIKERFHKRMSKV